jgi:hypothetical protein
MRGKCPPTTTATKIKRKNMAEKPHEKNEFKRKYALLDKKWDLER